MNANILPYYMYITFEWIGINAMYYIFANLIIAYIMPSIRVELTIYMPAITNVSIHVPIIKFRKSVE